MAASSDGTASRARPRGPGRRWPPGVSGNPRGRRPALPPDLVALKAVHGPQFLARLAALVNSRDERVDPRVLPVALEYTYGRAPLSIDVAAHLPPPADDADPDIVTLTWHLPSLPVPMLWMLRALARTAREGADVPCVA